MREKNSASSLVLKMNILRIKTWKNKLQIGEEATELPYMEAEYLTPPAFN